jgi:hypothetical protein
MPACFNTPSKKDSTDTFRGFQKVDFQWEKTDGIVVTYEIRVFFEGAQKEFSSIFLKTL